MPTRALLTTAILAIATPAIALPTCYMESAGQIVDLNHMCGRGSGGIAAAPAANQRVVSLGDEVAEDTPTVDDLASLQLYLTRYFPQAGESVVNVRVEFSRSAIVGTTVIPYIEANGRRYSFAAVERQRGSRDVYFTVRIPGNQENIALGGGFEAMSVDAVRVGLGRQ